MNLTDSEIKLVIVQALERMRTDIELKNSWIDPGVGPRLVECSGRMYIVSEIRFICNKASYKITKWDGSTYAYPDEVEFRPDYDDYVRGRAIDLGVIPAPGNRDPFERRSTRDAAEQLKA